MKLAQRDEIWLHTKDIPGSHVLIRSREPSEQTLFEAAQLAAYFSKSRHSSSVPVDYTRIRHVKNRMGPSPDMSHMIISKHCLSHQMQKRQQN